jgi:hypothetical protein
MLNRAVLLAIVASCVSIQRLRSPPTCSAIGRKKLWQPRSLEERANDDWINAATLMVFCSIAV